MPDALVAVVHVITTVSDVTTMPSYQVQWVAQHVPHTEQRDSHDATHVCRHSQEKFVQAYLKQTDKIPPANMFNAKGNNAARLFNQWGSFLTRLLPRPTGRAYPDVVAVGHNLEISWNRKFMPIDGTSASAPIFAGVVSLVNSQRVSHSMPPLGFLGPLLYTTAGTREEGQFVLLLLLLLLVQCATSLTLAQFCCWQRRTQVPSMTLRLVITSVVPKASLPSAARPATRCHNCSTNTSESTQTHTVIR